MKKRSEHLCNLRWLIWACTLLGIVPALLLCTTLTNAKADAQQPAHLRIIAPAGVATGQPFTVSLVLDDPAISASDSYIASYETTMLFDTTAAHVREVEPALTAEPFLPLGPVEMASGVAFGAYPCGGSGCTAQASVAAPPQSTSVPAALALATMTLVGDKAGRIELRFEHTLVVDSDGSSLSLPPQTLSFVVGDAATTLFSAPAIAAGAVQPRPTAADLTGNEDITGNGVVDAQDLSEVLLAWSFAHAQEQPCSVDNSFLPDLNGDGCVDVLDLQRVITASGPTLNLPSEPATTAASSVLTLTVNVGTDKPDASPGDGVCATTSGVCSLRAAIGEANAHPGPDTIHFAIPGNGIHTIQLTGPLPALNDLSGGATIDGYSQPGAQANSDPWISNATILVQIRGNGYSSFNGLSITSPNNVVRGLSFFELYQSIHLYGPNAHDNVIAGNFIGTDAQGVAFSATDTELGIGVMVEEGAAHNLIGGPAFTDRNVISGSGSKGVALFHAGTNGNIISNNIIGLNPSGTARLPNFRHGVDLNFDASNNLVGGSKAHEYNVISGNGWSGVELSHGLHTTGNQIIGNFIGTTITGTRAAAYTANGTAAVHLKDGVITNTVAGNVIGGNPAGGVSITDVGTDGNQVYNNRIGISLDGSAIPNSDFGVGISAGATHSQIGPANLIVNNGVGVVLLNDDTNFNTITRNSIYANSSLGIDLDPVGANISFSHLITGANHLLSAPRLTDFAHGKVSGSACLTCTVELFRDLPGISPSAQGRSYISTTKVGADGSFSVTLKSILRGEYVTATATDAAGNSSEFSSPLKAAEQVGAALYLPRVAHEP